MPNLFSSYELKAHTVKNRLVVPPMVCFDYSDADGIVSDRNVAHYEKLAAGGSGLVIIEALCVCREGRLHASQLGIWGEECVPGLRRITDAVHRHGAVALAQIHHAGARRGEGVEGRLIAPSRIESDGQACEEMSVSDISAVTEKFVMAAGRARAAGFDGVELHGCHGYLISQFFSDVTNLRHDAYGADRAKFAADIVRGVRNAEGGGFIVCVRMGGNDPDMQSAVGYAKELEKAGADILHVSTGYRDYRPADLVYTEDENYNWIVRSGIIIKRNVGIPVIVVNGIRTPFQASYIIEEKLSDFTAVGRGMLVDPDWIVKMSEDRPVAVCRSCMRCNWFTDPSKCPAV